MGLFTPKISAWQAAYVEQRLQQLQDTVRLINTTTKPDVFFKRLHFSMDILLDLQRYEKYKIFKGSLPSRDYAKIIANLEAIVDDFVSRAVEANNIKIASLKTDAAKTRNSEKFCISLISAFDCAQTFWSGSKGLPHYSGPLFTPSNYQRVQEMYDALDNI